jgi:hypothetical protein
MAGASAMELLMSRGALCVLATVLAILVPRTMAALEGEPDGPSDGATIFGQLERANELRAASLSSYWSTRRYSVFEPGHEADAELVVSMQFVAPSTKSFTPVSARGVGWIQKRVFGRLMEAETQAAAGKDHADSAITSANYTARLVGTDQLRGRDCWVLSLEPKRRDKYLFTGKAWIDKGDVAIARLEGEPAKSPSFWVVRAPFVREYQRVDQFWLPLQDETHSYIRFAGEYVFRIQYADYQITSYR